MSDRVEVMVPMWGYVSFGVHRLTEPELAELRAIRDARAFTERLLTLSVRYWRDGVKVWGDDWRQHTCHDLRVPPPSAYTAAELASLLDAAVALNELVVPAEDDLAATSPTKSQET